MNKLGKRGREWSNALRKLKAKFTFLGIQTCEFNFVGCWGNASLGFSHKTKRRFIQNGDTESLMDVVLCCNFCHSIVENAKDKVERHDHVINGREEKYFLSA